MNAYDKWLEEPYDSSWQEEDDDSKEYCPDEYMTEDEIKEYMADRILEEQYEMYCNAVDAV